MTTHSLRRWGAVLIAGGVVTFVAYLFFPSSPDDPPLQTCAAGVLVGLLLLLPGLIALQRAQSQHAAVNGWIGAGLLGRGGRRDRCRRRDRRPRGRPGPARRQHAGLNGIDAAARLSASRPEVAVLMLTMFDDDASVFAALRAGARGYVLKDSGRDGLLRAIRAVAGPS
jgi:hypothetical protein